MVRKRRDAVYGLNVFSAMPLTLFLLACFFPDG
jgi:hypothetical protein